MLLTARKTCGRGQNVALGSYVRDLRKAVGLTQEALAERANLEQTWISQVETGRILEPSRSFMQRLANGLDVPIRDLYEAAGIIETEARALRERPVALSDIRRQFELVAPIEAPLIELEQLVSAGPGEAVAQGYEYMAPAVGQRRTQLYAAVVTGKCMDPEIRPGDRIVFDPQQPAEPGRVVVASVDGEAAMVKRLVERAGRRYLEALDGKRIPIDERVRIVGVVTEVRRRI